MTGDVQLRRAEPGDAAAIVALYERLGDGSRHQRFAQATPRLCSTIRRALTDFSAGPVWVAIRERQVIGEARLVRSTRDGCVHLAVTVADEHQGRGVGHRLAAVALRAGLAGGDVVALSMLASNVAARRLAQRSGIPLELRDGLYEGRTGRTRHPGTGGRATDQTGDRHVA